MTQTEAVITGNQKISSGIIREYIPSMGGHTTLVIIDAKPDSMVAISVDHGQIILSPSNSQQEANWFFFWSDTEDRYILRKPSPV